MLLGLEFNRPFLYWRSANSVARQKVSAVRMALTQLFDGQSQLPGQRGQARTCSVGSDQRADKARTSVQATTAGKELILSEKETDALEAHRKNDLNANAFSIVSLDSLGSFCAIRDANGATLGTGKREFCEVLMSVLGSNRI